MNSTRAHVGASEPGEDTTPNYPQIFHVIGIKNSGQERPSKGVGGETDRTSHSRDAIVFRCLSVPIVILAVRAIHPREFLFVILRVDRLILCPSPTIPPEQSAQPAL